MSENTERPVWWSAMLHHANTEPGDPNTQRKAFEAGWVAALSRPVPDDSGPLWATDPETGRIGPTRRGREAWDAAPVVPVTGGVDLEAIDAIRANHKYVRAPGDVGLYTDRVCAGCGEWEGQCDALTLLSSIDALRSRLSPPTRDALATMIYDAWSDWNARVLWKGGGPESSSHHAADAVLAALSSPETEGEKN